MPETSDQPPRNRIVPSQQPNTEGGSNLPGPLRDVRLTATQTNSNRSVSPTPSEAESSDGTAEYTLAELLAEENAEAQAAAIEEAQAHALGRPYPQRRRHHRGNAENIPALPPRRRTGNSSGRRERSTRDAALSDIIPDYHTFASLVESALSASVSESASRSGSGSEPQRRSQPPTRGTGNSARRGVNSGRRGRGF